MTSWCLIPPCLAQNKVGPTYLGIFGLVVLSKVLAFSCQLLLDCLPTCLNLLQRNLISDVHFCRCVLCGQGRNLHNTCFSIAPSWLRYATISTSGLVFLLCCLLTMLVIISYIEVCSKEKWLRSLGSYFGIPQFGQSACKGMLLYLTMVLLIFFTTIKLIRQSSGFRSKLWIWIVTQIGVWARCVLAISVCSSMVLCFSCLVHFFLVWVFRTEITMVGLRFWLGGEDKLLFNLVALFIALLLVSNAQGWTQTLFSPSLSLVTDTLYMSYSTPCTLFNIPLLI